MKRVYNTVSSPSVLPSEEEGSPFRKQKKCETKTDLEIFTANYKETLAAAIQNNNLYSIYEIWISMFYKVISPSHIFNESNPKNLNVKDVDIWVTMRNMARTNNNNRPNTLSDASDFIINMNYFLFTQEIEDKISLTTFKKKAGSFAFIHYAGQKELAPNDISNVINFIDSIPDQDRLDYLATVCAGLFTRERQLSKIPSAISVLVAYPLKQQNLNGFGDLLLNIKNYIINHTRNLNSQGNTFNYMISFLVKDLHCLLKLLENLYSIPYDKKYIRDLACLKLVNLTAERISTEFFTRAFILYTNIKIAHMPIQAIIQKIDTLPYDGQKRTACLVKTVEKLFSPQRPPESIFSAINTLVVYPLSQRNAQGFVDLLLLIEAHIKANFPGLNKRYLVEEFILSNLNPLLNLLGLSAEDQFLLSKNVDLKLAAKSREKPRQPLWYVAMLQLNNNQITTEYIANSLLFYKTWLNQKNLAGLTSFQVIINMFLNEVCENSHSLNAPSSLLSFFLSLPCKSLTLLPYLKNAGFIDIFLETIVQNYKYVVSSFSLNIISPPQPTSLLEKALNFLASIALNFPLSHDNDLEFDNLFKALHENGRVDIIRHFNSNNPLPLSPDLDISTYLNNDLQANNSPMLTALLKAIPNHPLSSDTLRNIIKEALKNKNITIENLLLFCKALKPKVILEMRNEEQDTKGSVLFYHFLDYLYKNQQLPISLLLTNLATAIRGCYCRLYDLTFNRVLYWKKPNAYKKNHLDLDRYFNYTGAVKILYNANSITQTEASIILAIHLEMPIDESQQVADQILNYLEDNNFKNHQTGQKICNNLLLTVPTLFLQGGINKALLWKIPEDAIKNYDIWLSEAYQLYFEKNEFSKCTIIFRVFQKIFTGNKIINDKRLNTHLAGLLTLYHQNRNEDCLNLIREWNASRPEFFLSQKKNKGLSIPARFLSTGGQDIDKKIEALERINCQKIGSYFLEIISKIPDLYSPKRNNFIDYFINNYKSSSAKEMEKLIKYLFSMINKDIPNIDIPNIEAKIIQAASNFGKIVIRAHLKKYFELAFLSDHEKTFLAELFISAIQESSPVFVNYLFKAMNINLFQEGWHLNNCNLQCNNSHLDHWRPSPIISSQWSHNYREFYENYFITASITPLDAVNQIDVINKGNLFLYLQYDIQKTLKSMASLGHYHLDSLFFVDPITSELNYHYLKAFLRYNPMWTYARSSSNATLLDIALNKLIKGIPEESKIEFIEYCFFLVIKGVIINTTNMHLLMTGNFLSFFNFILQSQSHILTEFISEDLVKHFFNSLDTQPLNDNIKVNYRKNLLLFSKTQYQTQFNEIGNQEEQEEKKGNSRQSQLWKNNYLMSRGLFCYPEYKDLSSENSISEITPSITDPIEYTKISLINNNLGWRKLAQNTPIARL